MATPPTYKYQITGVCWKKGEELAYIFDTADAEVLIRSGAISNEETAPYDIALQPLVSTGKHIRASVSGNLDRQAEFT